MLADIVVRSIVAVLEGVAGAEEAGGVEAEMFTEEVVAAASAFAAVSDAVSNAASDAAFSITSRAPVWPVKVRAFASVLAQPGNTAAIEKISIVRRESFAGFRMVMDSLMI